MSLTWKARQESGFTLIELLVVILVIGVLAAIAIPFYNAQRDQANGAAMRSDVKNAAVAMENAYVRDGKYPTDQRYLSGGVQTSPTQSTFMSEVKYSPGGYLAYYVYADPNDRTKTFYGANKVAEGTKPGYCVQSSHVTIPGLRWRWLSTENKPEPLPCPGKTWESTPAP